MRPPRWCGGSSFVETSGQVRAGESRGEMERQTPRAGIRREE